MHLLLVEDEPLLRRTLVESLRDVGWAVSEADSAEAALEIVAADDPPAVLVTDVDLGRAFCRDGIALAATMRQWWPPMRILYMKSDPEGLIGCDLGRHERCIAKPFSATMLVRAVCDLMPECAFASEPGEGRAAGRSHATLPVVAPSLMPIVPARAEAPRELV